MSKRKREAVARAAVENHGNKTRMSADAEHAIAIDSRRRRPGGFSFQTKILIVPIIALLGLGAFGAG